MRVLVGMTVGLALLAAPVLAEDAAGTRAAKTNPLKPGKSAGIHAAQTARAGVALIGAGAIIAVVVVAAGAGSSGGGAQPNSESVVVTTS
jgi:hypothetical protein